jgi:hypothetical protein
MTLLTSIALGFAVFRGVMLAVLTIPWLVKKRRDATEAERSLLWMVASRSILLGVAILVLAIGSRTEALAWTLAADGLFQLFDTVHAVALRKRSLAMLPAILCVLDGCAAAALLH